MNTPQNKDEPKNEDYLQMMATLKINITKNWTPSKIWEGSQPQNLESYVDTIICIDEHMYDWITSTYCAWLRRSNKFLWEHTESYNTIFDYVGPNKNIYKYTRAYVTIQDCTSPHGTKLKTIHDHRETHKKILELYMTVKKQVPILDKTIRPTKEQRHYWTIPYNRRGNSGSACQPSWQKLS